MAKKKAAPPKPPQGRKKSARSASSAKRKPQKKTTKKTTAKRKVSTSGSRAANKKTAAKKKVSRATPSARKKATKKTVAARKPKSATGRRAKQARDQAAIPAKRTRASTAASAGAAKRKTAPAGDHWLRPWERKFLWIAASISVVALVVACVALFRPPRATDEKTKTSNENGPQYAKLMDNVSAVQESVKLLEEAAEKSPPGETAEVADTLADIRDRLDHFDLKIDELNQAVNDLKKTTTASPTRGATPAAARLTEVFDKLEQLSQEVSDLHQAVTNLQEASKTQESATDESTEPESTAPDTAPPDTTEPNSTEPESTEAESTEKHSTEDQTAETEADEPAGDGNENPADAVDPPSDDTGTAPEPEEAGADPPEDTDESSVPDGHSAQLKQRARLWDEMQLDLKDKDYEGALEKAKSTLELDRELASENPTNLVETLGTLAVIHERREDFDAAKPVREEHVELCANVYGTEDWHVTDARVRLKHAETMAKLDDAERQRVIQADELNRELPELFQQKDYAKALEVSKQAIEIHKELLGIQSYLYANSLSNQATIRFAMGDSAGAERGLIEVADIQREALGTKHPAYLRTLRNLADVYLELAEDREKQGDLGAAVVEYQKLHDVRILLYGENDWRVTDARLAKEDTQFRHDLSDANRSRLIDANLLHESVFRLFEEKKPQEAIDAARQVIEIRGNVLGENHKKVADDKLYLANLLVATGQVNEAPPLYEQAVATYRQVLGDQHPTFFDFLALVAGYYENVQVADDLAAAKLLEEARAIYAGTPADQGPHYRDVHDRLVDAYRRAAQLNVEGDDLDAARQLRQRVLDLQVEQFGGEHWRTSDARMDLERIDTLAGLDAGERQQLADAARLAQQARHLYELGRAAEGVEPATGALDTRRKILGEDHIDTAESMSLLGVMYFGAGEYEQAKPLYRRALEIRHDQLDPKHPVYTTSLNNLAYLYLKLGEYEAAEPLFAEALEISRHGAAENPADLATSLNNLARLHHDRGHYDKAKPLYQEALRLSEQRYEEARVLESHMALQPLADYAQSLNNLAGLYRDMGDLAEAETRFEYATEYRRQVFGDKHPLYANSLDNLAQLAKKKGETEKAGQLWEQASEILQQVEPVGRHPDYIRTLSNLAALYHDQGKFDDAGRLYQQALEIRREVFGEKHGETAFSLCNLAAHYRSTGRFDEARELYDQAVEIVKDRVGEEHPNYALMLRNLAKLHDSRGNPDEAKPLLREALEINRKMLEQMASIQSERQQLAMAATFREMLDLYLSLGERSDMPDDDVYLYVLRWKAAVFARQREIRVHRRMIKESEDPDMADMIEELERLACLIAESALSGRAPGKDQDHMLLLAQRSTRKEELEVELARRSRLFQEKQNVTQLTPAQLKEKLDPNVVLVDLIEYEHSCPPEGGKGSWQSERRLAAFVVRKGEPVKRIDLGLVAPIARAVTLWRGTIKRKNPIVGDDDPAVLLREKVWLPIEEQLQPDDVLLVSPDGALSRMPLVALPGAEENTYLIEERAIATVAVPQMLPELLDEEPADEDEASLLLVGDVDFDADISKDEELETSSRRTGIFGTWKPLPETRTEMLAVSDSFEMKSPDGKLKKLRKHDATEDMLREEAAQHRWLHLATHGYFAPAEKHSALAPADEDAQSRAASISREAAAISTAGVGGYHPGVLSGVVLAGANSPSDTALHDGVITAEEVAEMDLRKVEVVVLSACETGLGEVAGGEGALGLQRALQIAGVNTVVAGLWTVDDLATQNLMVHFYEQLWEPGESKISKLEAFRKSQLMLLNEGPKRGFVEEVDDTPEMPMRTPPFYWAAFSISGDWR